jgi:hypothetical protein
LKKRIYFEETITYSLGYLDLVVEPFYEPAVFSSFKVIGNTGFILFQRTYEFIKALDFTLLHLCNPPLNLGNRRLSAAFGIKIPFQGKPEGT